MCFTFLLFFIVVCVALGPGFYIEKMLEKLEAALDRETNLLGQISDLTTFHQHELQAKLNAQHKDLSQEHLSMLENVREEGSCSYFLVSFVELFEIIIRLAHSNFVLISYFLFLYKHV